jgi:membrane-associated phospholipid phosphatase
LSSFVKILAQRSTFLFLTFTSVVFGYIVCQSSGNAAIFSILYKIGHTYFLDIFFSILSFLGNGYFAVALIILFIANNRTIQFGIQILFSFVLSGCLAQLIKNIVEKPRPKEFFTDSNWQHVLLDAHAGFNSFPSGHTTTVFALATMLCVLNKSKHTQILIFLIAVLVGYSRIYLGHHFLEDVIAGAVLGTLTSCCTLLLFELNTNQKRYKIQHKNKLDWL